MIVKATVSHFLRSIRNRPEQSVIQGSKFMVRPGGGELLKSEGFDEFRRKSFAAKIVNTTSPLRLRAPITISRNLNFSECIPLDAAISWHVFLPKNSLSIQSGSTKLVFRSVGRRHPEAKATFRLKLQFL